MAPVPPFYQVRVNGKRQNKWTSRICQGAAPPSFGLLAHVSCSILKWACPGGLGRPWSIYSVAATILGLGFCLDQVFLWETIFFIVTVLTNPIVVNQGPHSFSSPLCRLVLLWSDLEPHLDFCFIHICNFRLRVYSVLLVFFHSLAGKAFLARSINQQSSGVMVAGLRIVSD